MQTALDHTLMALADPTRRAILQRLAAGEARVTEIADPFAMSLNGVSKHIRMLERADLVRRRRAGGAFSRSTTAARRRGRMDRDPAGAVGARLVSWPSCGRRRRPSRPAFPPRRKKEGT